MVSSPPPPAPDDPLPQKSHLLPLSARYTVPPIPPYHNSARTLDPKYTSHAAILTNHPKSDTGLPSGWEIRHSNSKNLPYYFNPTTKESRWEPPTGTNTDTLSTYMSTNHTASLSRPAPPQSDTPKIRAAHLLVKHAGSRRPASWRSAEITRSKDEARALLEGYEARIKGGEIALGDLAVSESDCSSARKKGDLGFFGRGEMQREFEEAAFALQPGQMSGVVETASGLHLIERLE